MAMDRMRQHQAIDTSLNVPGGAGACRFPGKLHRMLTDVDNNLGDGLQDCVSWLPHGRAFIVKNTDVFAAKVIPKYFYQLKYTSFQRHLNLFGFRKVQKNGPDKGAYYHEFFLRGVPQLAEKIRRRKPRGKEKSKQQGLESEPRLYALPPMPKTCTSSPSSQFHPQVTGGSSPQRQQTQQSLQDNAHIQKLVSKKSVQNEPMNFKLDPASFLAGLSDFNHGNAYQLQNNCPSSSQEVSMNISRSLTVNRKHYKKGNTSLMERNTREQLLQRPDRRQSTPSGLPPSDEIKVIQQEGKFLELTATTTAAAPLPLQAAMHLPAATSTPSFSSPFPEDMEPTPIGPLGACVVDETRGFTQSIGSSQRTLDALQFQEIFTSHDHQVDDGGDGFSIKNKDDILGELLDPDGFIGS